LTAPAGAPFVATLAPAIACRSEAESGRRLACVLIVCLSLAALAAGPCAATSLAAEVRQCGHVVVGYGESAIGISDIRATGVSCARARSVFRIYIKHKLHPPKEWRVIKGPNAATIILGSGRARIEGSPFNA
jgi:hypothetical protein